MFVFIHIAQHFNPRSREGSDVNLPINVTLFIYFNPRSREGSDEEVYEKMMGNSKFQSTLPRGERQKIHNNAAGSREFQSTLPRGERPLLSAVYVLTVEISIHAPARGATYSVAILSTSCSDFNPRSREGSDLCCRPYMF